MGTAGLERICVNGYNRAPRPAPKMTARISFNEGIIASWNFLRLCCAARCSLFYTHHLANAIKNEHKWIDQQDQEIDNGKEQVKFHRIKSPEKSSDSSQEDLRFSIDEVSI